MFGVSEVTSTCDRAEATNVRRNGSLCRATALLLVLKAADKALLFETLIAMVASRVLCIQLRQ
jgi:hypothetical protein